jgi:hypothetical protein
MDITGHDIGTVERVMHNLPVGSKGPNDLQKMANVKKIDTDFYCTGIRALMLQWSKC